MLETILAMPRQKRRMRTFSFVSGCHRLAGLIDDRLNAGPIVDLPRDHDVEIIRQPNQPAIEHPVRRARQRQPVADAVGPTMLDGSDMRRLGLRPATTVDQLPPRHRTAFAISFCKLS